MFQLIKNYQTIRTASNWQQIIENREIAKNNFRVSGNIKKANAFVKSVKAYQPHTHFAEHGEHIIFESPALALEPAYL